MRTLIARTGLSRGRLYNGVGDNITQYPAGAGEDNVGFWSRDYSYLAGNTVLWDGEFSAVLMDGRILSQGGNDLAPWNQSLPDFDEDENMADRGSVLNFGDKAGLIKGMRIHMDFLCPTFTDAGAWEVDSSMGTIDATLLNPLGTYLDSLSTPSYEGVMIDNAGAEQDVFSNVHTQARHYLRVPIHWAVYRVPLGPVYEGQDEFIRSAGGDSTGAAQLTYGPFGLLTAWHGVLYAAAHAVRLWEPSDGVKFVARGEFEVPYAAFLNGESDPDMVFGLGLDGADQFAQQGGGMLDTPAQRSRGRIIKIDLKLPQDVRARPDEVLIFHIQTGLARYQLGTLGGGSHVIIGEPILVDPGEPGGLTLPLHLGPYMALCNWHISAYFTAR